MAYKVFGFGAGALFVAAAIAAGAEMRQHTRQAQTEVALIDPAHVALQPAPIPTSWVIEGHPRTEAAEIAQSDDGSTKVYLWRTTAARFHWFYDVDEIIHVLDGEVFIDDGTHGERRLGPGDVAFFPVGAKTTWRVPDHLRKVATLKRPSPTLVAAAQRWVHMAKAWAKPEPAFAAD